jgi:FAD/FMN-containing dehydrogenase/Fe-S oxidoreductase
MHHSSVISEAAVKSLVDEFVLEDGSEVLTDDLSLGIYSTDASLYQLRPLAVVIPKTEKDLLSTVKWAYNHKIPLLPRGSGTSLAGQTTNRAIVVDFTKYFDKIIDINPEKRYAVVQPGVVRDQLNKELASYRLHFAPDPATTGRATIGGMIANNSSGTKSIRYGKTIDHVLELRVLLMDGTVLMTKETGPDSYQATCEASGKEAEIYRTFRQLIFENAEAIKSVFPKVMRRVSGYPLDEFVYSEEWNISKLLCGSEGTLGIILDAKVNLEPIPACKAAVTVHYDDRMAAIRSVPDIVKFSPAAVEMLDYHVFELSKKNNITQSLHKRLINGDPQATLSVEFYCNTPDELESRLNEFLAFIPGVSGVYAWPILRTQAALDDSWNLRKNGLGLIMGDPDGRKPVPFIEDMAIPLENLADYISDLLAICDKKEVETVLYAHASVGVLHVRPGLDMTKAKDIELMKEITDEVFQLVKKYHGSWSGEHGDGRNRSPKLKTFFGDKVYGIMKQVKNLFDPEHLLNPGIIIDPEPMDKHLRYGAGYQDTPYTFVYKYRKDHSFNSLVHNCSGVGACRHKTGGTMCPSFKATGDEADSTRGRANALRLALAGQHKFTDLTDPKVIEILDLCLSCKACKSECPSNVDMAKLKSEVLQMKYDKGIISLREKAIKQNAKIARRVAGWKAPIVNKIQKLYPFRWLAEKVLGTDKRRILPEYTSQSLTSWYQSHYTHQPGNTKVALFADTYINYHEPHIGKAAVELLNACGFDVVLADVGCCQRPRISNGFLKDAAREGAEVVDRLMTFIEQGMHVVVCEPSCTTALIDDLPDLIQDADLAGHLQQSVLALDEFLAFALESGTIEGQFTTPYNEIMLHGHCHQKATFGTTGMKKIYQSIEHLKFSMPDIGCCGMAGSFGYEKEHYDISKKISELVLIPAIQNAGNEMVIVANGFSCRHQIKDFSGRKALHWVETVGFEKKNKTTLAK